MTVALFNSIKMKKTKLLFIILTTLVIVALPQIIIAAGVGEIQTGLDFSANKAEIPTGPQSTDLTVLIGNLVNYLFGVIGALFLVIIIIGGVMWMTAAGNEERVSRASKILIAGVEGIVILFFSYTIVYFLINVFGQATSF